MKPRAGTASKTPGLPGVFSAVNFLRRPFFSCLVCLTITANGCAYYKQTAYRPSEQLSADWLQYYQYPRTAQAVNEKIVATTSKYKIRRIEFPLSVPVELMDQTWDQIRQEWKAFDDSRPQKGKDLEYKVRIDFYELPTATPQPLIILSPILGGDNQVAEIFARFFARNGFHAAILHRYKLKAKPEDELDEVERYMRMSVMRARQGAEWLMTQKSVDSTKVGTFGISFGGIVNILLAGLEPKLSAHVIGMAGGNLAQIFVNCPENAIKPYVEYMIKEKGWTKKSLQSELHKKLRTDSLTLARSVDSSKVLQFISIFDRVIARKEQRNLWKALGEPEAVYFPFGHYSSVVIMPYMAYKSLKFFRKKFYGPEPPGNQGNFAKGVYVPNPAF